MNRYIINMAVVAALMVPSTAAIAQTTHYTPAAEGKYESYMNFTGQVVENGVPVNGAEVAVFVAGECRQAQVSHNLSGTGLNGQPYSIDGLVTSYLAWGQSHQENITFKVWLPGGEERELAAVCPLVVDDRTGMPSAPFILDVGKTAHTAVFNFRQGGEDFSGITAEHAVNSLEYDGLTVTITDTKTGDSYANYVSQEQGLRVAPGATVTLTAPEGYSITGIWPLNNTQRLVLDQTGTTFGYDGWTGRAQSVTLTNKGTAMNNLYGMEVRYAKAFILGDANGDGTVSIADVTAIINRINDAVTGTFVKEAADVNGDGYISIADVTGVINIINK